MRAGNFRPARAPYALASHILIALGVTILVLDVYAFRITVVHAINIPTSAVITVCGDGIVSAPVELCDNGAANNIGGYGSSTAERKCNPGCSSFDDYCGDGVLQVRFQEECDDGNSTNGDLCTSLCKSETAAPPASSGSPTVGSIPAISGAQPGAIPSVTGTKVVLRGKAYPNAPITILKDGEPLGSTQADSNADFLFTTSAITPGVTVFGFLARDSSGTDSITTSAIFDVVQSAITTVSNILIPPTIRVNKTQVAVGELLTIAGQSVPNATIKTDIFGKARTTLTANGDASGLWALQVDTKSLSQGPNTAKSLFETASSTKSGYGRSISFTVGEGLSKELAGPDINKDGKVNLVDFSIFLLYWETAEWKTDFNGDRTANLADFSIMLFAWTG